MPTVQKASPMSTWTTEKPTVAGWYWYKNHITQAVDVVLVRRAGCNYPLEACDADGRWDTVTNWHGQWSGPILPPEEVQP